MCVCMGVRANGLAVLCECLGYVNVIGIESVNARKSIQYSQCLHFVLCGFPLFVSRGERKIVWFFLHFSFFFVHILNAIL